MNSRERLIQTINHKEPDQLVVDIGAGGQTGMGVCAVNNLRRALFGETDIRVKVIEPYQMLGEVDEELRKSLHLDVIGIHPPKNMFGFKNENWKPFTMHDGTVVEVPGDFNYTRDQEGAVYMYAEGDMSSQRRAKMAVNSYFFDAVETGLMANYEHLNPDDNTEEFGILSQEDLEYYVTETEHYYNNTAYGIYMTLPGMAFGDIALVPAPWMKSPKGIRGVEEWYLATLAYPGYIKQVFEKQCEIALKNIELLAEKVGDKAQVVFVSGTDFGTQNGLFLSVETYRDLYKPYQKAVNDKIHELTNWKVFIHSCGAISELIPEFIEAGFDILNPVQISAKDMDPQQLKNEFGKNIVFWGGGIDTQKTLPFGTPDEVYREVRKNIDIFSPGGGFVFNTVHNIQSNIPVENLLAMFRALNDARKIASGF
ncbi:MAG: methyltransferase [Bacteroidales bacterium]|nr:methyltransferase [Bacteroidales bacterium]MBN2763059.1 methyltransferase [Bacteroidales bacterium]